MLATSIDKNFSTFIISTYIKLLTHLKKILLYYLLAYSSRCSLVCNVLENIKYPYWKGRRLMQILRYKIRCIKNSGLRQKAYFMFADQCMYTLRIILSVGLSVMLLNNFPSFYRRYFLCKDSLCIITLYVCLLCTLFAFICFAFCFF